MAERCLICEETVDSDRSVVSKRGMQGLLRASIARQDGKKSQFKNQTSGVVHTYCRRNYIRPGTIAADLRNAASTSQSSSRRSSSLEFDFKAKCVFCCEAIDDEFKRKEKKKPVERRQQVYEVRSLEMKKNVLDTATQRGDEWGQQVARRISIVSDLVAAEAIYHDNCCKKFFSRKLSTGEKRGHPVNDYVTTAMEEIYTFLNKKQECQYSLDEVMDVITGEKPTVKTVKDKLKETYGERLIITQLHSQQKTVLCFLEVGHKILNASWYDSSSRGRTAEEERLRVVRTAASIIKTDIQSQAYDTSRYPAGDGFLDEAEQMIPSTLTVFLEELLNSRTRDQQKSKIKEVSLSHAIISAVRPRSFVSPIMHGIAFFIHRKFGAKSLVNLLSNLGFSASYNDAQMLEVSAIHSPQQVIPQGVFGQYVFDNADYNVATLDGLKTFHSMGGIKCLTPARKLPPALPIQRMRRAPSIQDVGTLGVLPLEMYENLGKIGLKAIVVEDISDCYPVPDIPFPNLSDVLWIVGKWLRIEDIPEWKGYMRGLYEGESPERSAVLPLPFINAPPSDYNTIYTALKYAATQCHKQGMKTCYVTFDQPLYIKGREIVASCQDNLKSVVVRLGGFHMLMSYLGGIGHIMAGSGLKEVLCTVFAANSVDKMLTGHAFSRAVRGHLLVQTVLAEIILNSLEVSDEQNREIMELLSKLKDGALTQDMMKQNVQLALLQEQMKNSLLSLKGDGPTAALWVQYFHMVSIMKQFIEAERSGNWELHLCSVQQMIPFFHASGHLQYAKCAHLYVQDMRALPATHPHHFKFFSRNGYFTVSRSDSPGSGNWSDMTIELTLMRGMKTHGGLTRGRGITDAVLAKWVGGASTSTSICSALEDFAGLHFSTGEQHVDYRVSRQTRNDVDRKKLFEWFAQHPPFTQSPVLVSLATGIVANCDVNCHKALEEGKNTMRKVIGQKFGELKQARKCKVLSLASMSSTMKINNVLEVVDPLLIFQRVAISKKNDEDIQDLLCYELAPFPLALFDECGMRKTKKSALYDVFPVHENTSHLKMSVNVIDGGFLLHRVKWSTGSTFSVVFNQYVNYIKRHYGERCTVVFDGYIDPINSTKRAEQQRRNTTKTSVDIEFTEGMAVTVQQEHFLGNVKNKAKFISMLSEKMITEGIEVRQAEADADTMIVRCGVEKAVSNEHVAVIGEDVDLLVLLIALAPPDSNILFVKPGRGKVESRTYSSLELQKLDFAESILFIHGFSGCDTTSSIFRKGKSMIVKLFSRDSSLKAISNVFYKSSSTLQEVTAAGERMFLALYNAREQDLNTHRYLAFLKSTTKVKPDLPSLPPTRGSAQHHSHRAYLQVQNWLGNQLPPTDWGWAKGIDGNLRPLTTMEPAAPASILSTIFCNCTTGCGTRCGCRKAGIHCSTVCGNCEGDCTNSPPVDNESLDEEEIDGPDILLDYC